MLFHFDWKKPNGNKADELDMIESFGLDVRRKHDLWLVPTTYHSFKGNILKENCNSSVKGIIMSSLMAESLVLTQCELYLRMLSKCRHLL